MRYSDVIDQEYSDKIGMIDVMGQTLRLCNHMEQIDGLFYATAMCIDVRDRKVMADMGVPTKNWATKGNEDGEEFMFLSTEILKNVKPKYEGDDITAVMIKRLIDHLEPLNKKPYQYAA